MDNLVFDVTLVLQNKKDSGGLIDQFQVDRLENLNACVCEHSYCADVLGYKVTMVTVTSRQEGPVCGL